ncbi:hypothetical protein Bca101_028983 [Brassica carinata]
MKLHQLKKQSILIMRGETNLICKLSMRKLSLKKISMTKLSTRKLSKKKLSKKKLLMIKMECNKKFNH